MAASDTQNMVHDMMSAYLQTPSVRGPLGRGRLSGGAVTSVRARLLQGIDLLVTGRIISVLLISLIITG